MLFARGRWMPISGSKEANSSSRPGHWQIRKQLMVFCGSRGPWLLHLSRMLQRLRAERTTFSGGQMEGSLARQRRAGWRSPFGILAVSAGFLRSANTTKAVIYSLLAFALQLVIGFGPLGIGVTLLFQGRPLAALLVPIAIYV